MNQWPFIIAAYMITSIATIAIVVVSFVGMRRAEKQVDSL
jgi:hypothetical protein